MLILPWDINFSISLINVHTSHAAQHVLSSSYHMQLSQSKENAAVARSEASRATAQADFQKERADRLFNSLETQRQQLESLMASNAKYQSLLTETERKLHAAQSLADEATDKLRQQSMKAESMEAEKRVLETAEKRLSKESAELSQEKFKLAAELEATRKLHAEREEQLSADAVKAREEAARAARELADAQRELTSARNRADAAARAAEHADSRANDKTSRLAAELQRARDDLSATQHRASTAEAKVDLLQEAVRKAEERVARLEMERTSRLATGASTEMVSVPVLATEAGSRERDLTTQLKLLREELVAAQEQAAAARGHAKHLETLASTAEEALKSVQADHEKYKKEAAARIFAADQDANALRAALEAKEEELKDAKKAEQEFAAECDRMEREFDAERISLQHAVEQAKQDGKQDRQHVDRLKQDAEALRKQLEDAKNAYDAEVVAHGDALRRVSAAEAAHSSAQQRLQVVTQDLDAERSARQSAESELRSKLEESESKLSELRRQAESLSQQRDTLQEQLEKAAGATEAGGDFANVLRLLRQEREAAEINLHLTERELVRLRQEAVVARRAAEEARAQLAAEVERSQGAVRDESGQQEILQRMEQFNLLRESNTTLRSDNARHQKQLQETQAKLRQSENQLAPLQQRIRSLEADREAAGAELAAAKEQADRWQKRAQQLMAKYESVDVAEYQRVSSELKEAEATAARQAEELETLRKQLGTSQAEKEQLVQLKTDLETVKSEAQDHRKKASLLWHTIISVCNPQKKSLQEWKAIQTEKERKLIELEAKVKLLESKQGDQEAQGVDEIAGLRANATHLETELQKRNNTIEKLKEEVKQLRQRALEATKKALESKKATVAELNQAKESLEQAKKSEKAAADKVLAIEQEKASLAKTIESYKEQLHACHVELQAAKRAAAQRFAVGRLSPAAPLSDAAPVTTAAAAAKPISTAAAQKLGKRKQGPPQSVPGVPGGDTGTVDEVEVITMIGADDVEAEQPPPTKKSRVRPEAAEYLPSPKEEERHEERQFEVEEAEGGGPDEMMAVPEGAGENEAVDGEEEEVKDCVFL